ncbi:MAG TPA: ornithine cyclodeaminase family protein [Candidatus Methylomirabilis sp.]|jgi:ornithine cyclodeaminase/alanine dehydrogenase-like protein (mu-crystallin family)|nr:ornithine cyclodeaminase family protein [Candidatus Methylomirabilis sp.]
MVLLLTRDDLQALLPVPEVIGAMGEAFAILARGESTVPLRTVLEVPGRGTLLIMPARLGKAEGVGTKVVGVFPGNRAAGLPVVPALYLLTDPETGLPQALLDGTTLTLLRTAATSALAARHLARAECRTLGVFGAGAQAAAHVETFRTLFPLTRVILKGRDPVRAAACAARLARTAGLAVSVAADPAEVVREADLVVTATTAQAPLFDGHDLKPGAHVTAVGAYTPQTRELDTVTIRRAKVVVDTMQGALAEAGELLIPMAEGAIGRDHILADLAELVTGARSIRTSPEDITVFKSVGFALEDLAAARLAYRKAQAAGRGTRLALD